ncbi:PqiC family protein [Paracoccus jeotgali]|uniref:PqiC family protein n=1 Tax=Paracoccus jeotgali TaxID=2065379 RepID=UPI0028B11221|nr:ABC-type transport auxiliary lipoprotein family protein [Paracoccus jeotgali]
MTITALRLSSTLLLGALALAGCDGSRTERYLIDPPTAPRVAGDQLGSAELKTVSLPDYAAADPIAWQDGGGAVRASSKVIWGDKPERAFTVALARIVSESSGASVIAEPWPLASPPQHKLDVRVEKALAGSDGFYRLSGRYFVSAEGTGAGTHHTRSFDVAVPVDPENPASVAQAASQALVLLGQQIAGLGGPGTTIIAKPPSDPYADLPPLF